MKARYNILAVLVIGIVAARTSGPGAASEGDFSRDHLLSVKSVWAVSERRFCSKEIVRSIELALRAFQHTRITNTTKCLPQDAPHFIGKIGCGKGAHAEIILLKSPVEVHDLLWPAPSFSKVYELIAFWDGWQPSRLKIGLGRRYPSTYTQGAPRILFMGVTSPYDFLRLGSGECTRAVSPSQVPKTI